MQATTIRSGAETGVVKRYLVSGIYSGIRTELESLGIACKYWFDPPMERRHNAEARRIR